MADFGASGDELTLAEELWLQEVSALDAGANQVFGRNNADDAYEWKSITAGSNVTVTHTAGGIEIAASTTAGASELDELDDVELSSLAVNDLLQYDGANWVNKTLSAAGIQAQDDFLDDIASLTDPNADRILFWDDSAGSLAWLAVGNSVAITTTTLDAIQDIRTSATPSFTGANVSAGTLTVGLLAGTIDAGGATSLEIPNGAAPTVNAAGEIAIDTTITDHTGAIKYYDGAEELTVIAVPTANLTTTDDFVLAYDADNNEFYFKQDADSGGATAWTDIGDATADTTIALAGFETTLTSTLDEASHTVLTISNTDADVANDTTLLKLQYVDDGDAEAIFFRAVDDSGGTPNVVFEIGANGAITSDAGATFAGHITFAADATHDIGTSTVGINDLHLGSGGIINFDGGDVTLTHSANTLTLAGGTLALGANSLTLTGSIAATGARVTKGWFTDLESTNAITISGAAVYYSGGTDVAVADGGTGASTAAGALTNLGLTATAAELNILDGATLDVNELNILDGVTATAAELNYLDIAALGTGAASKAVVLDAGDDYIWPATGLLTYGGTAITATGAEINILDGATLTVTELNYVDGVTSAIQTQLDAKLALAGGTMSGVITLGENTAIALDPAGSADGKYSGITVAGTAGAALAFGDLIYLDPTDSRWELADANAAAAADGDSRGVLGICVLAAAADGNATTILLQGIVRADAAFPALTIGAPVYVSETAGDIVVTQPTTTDVVIRIVGIAITADEIFFNPDNTWVTHT